MNFYKFRVLNTILLFFVGLLFGIYIGANKNFYKISFSVPNFIKKAYSGFNDYKPIYYGKKSFDEVSTHRSVSFIDSDTANVDLKNNTGRKNYVDMKQSKKNLEDYLLFEKIKDATNPMEDELDLVLDTKPENEKDGEEVYQINDFVLNPNKFYGKVIVSDRLLLLKGEKKDSKSLSLLFMYKLEGKDYYIVVDRVAENDEEIQNYKIGFYFKVKFVSKKGKLDEANIATEIIPTNDKVTWASGVSVF